MAWGALTDDNSVWPEDQPATPNPPAPDPYGGYVIPRILGELWRSATLPGDLATGKTSMATPEAQNRATGMTGLLFGGPEAEADTLGAGFRLYHGTKNFFEQPSTKHIGEGQGAQTYGWGLYGAQAEPVALDMRNQLSGDAVKIGEQVYRPPAFTPEEQALAWLTSGHIQQFENPYAYARGSVDNQVVRGQITPEDAGSIKKILDDWQTRGATPTSAGHMQEWEVNADPEHFLDWDYTVGDQSQHVLDALKRADWWPHLEEHLDSRFTYNNPTGHDVLRWLKEDYEPQEASQELVKLGIPGIRYLDRFSRLQAVKNGLVAQPGATRNFVLPDENIIKVVRHYNASGAPAALANVLYGQPGSTP